MKPKNSQQKKSKEFQDLQDLWYAKLAQTGFVDIEKDERLKQSAAHPYLRDAANYGKGKEFKREAKRQYYQMVSEHCQVEQFVCEADKIIMNRISVGTKIKVICEELKALGLKNNRKTVRYIIRKYEYKWKIRKWTPKQLTWRRT